MGLTIYPLTIKWGLLGTALSVILPNLYVFVVLSKKLMRLINYQYVEFMKYFVLPLINVIVMALLLLCFKTLVLDGKNIVNFVILVAIGITATFIVTFSLDKASGFGLRNNLKLILEML
jgi:chromate transport protein ChrA